MNTHDVKVFGYGEFAKEIVSQVNEVYKSVTVYSMLQDDLGKSNKNGSEIHLFDLSDNWDEFSDLNMEKTLFVCALDDDASNVFLTITLSDHFPDARLIAIASTHENASKLRLAGAHKVISKLQTAAEMIIDILEKPIATHVLQDILNEDTALITMQLMLKPTSSLIGKTVKKVAFEEQKNFIVLSVHTLSEETLFVFTSAGARHVLEEGDILVIIGYHEALEKFKRSVS